MKRIVIIAVLALVAIVGAAVVFHAASSSDSSSRRAAIGSGAPVAGEASLAITGVASGALPANGAPIKVSKWNWGAANNITIASATSGTGSGKLSFAPFHVTKNIDNASTALFGLMATGKTITTMTFKVGASLTYTFTQVYVVEQTQTGEGASGDEQVSFAYGKVCQVNAAAGASPQQCWNVVTNTPN